MVQKDIAVLYGDGIGPEIMAEALKVLDIIADEYGHKFTYHVADFGGVAYDKHGHPFPPETIDICDKADAILKGPIGGPRYDKIPDPSLRPEAGALLPLRKRYDTFANHRPVKLTSALVSSSPLKPEIIGDGIDILMIRELTGGIYFGEKIESDINLKRELFSRDVMEYTEPQVERIAHVAFSEARSRKKKKVFNIHKANVLATSRFWNKIVDRVHAEEFPDVELEHQLVDSAAFSLVVSPRKFDQSVMLYENMMGDILTDQGGGILGSLGLMPSACIGPKKGYYEPAHGSAPDIAGKGVANPYSMIGSAAYMLEKGFVLKEESLKVSDALDAVFGAGYRTRELATSSTSPDKVLSTKQFGDKVVSFLIGKN
jgi:3-isopropylmalate dehydrogenase